MTTPGSSACVIGWPVDHSRSPLIHNYWLKTYGITGEYRREAVPPDQFSAFIKSLSERGYAGANVTVPHKEAALALSQPDDRARAVGAANTLWFDGGLRSTNTDVEGFLSNLDSAAPGWDRGLNKAVVLGAGGAARAVIYGLQTRGVPGIVIINRTPSRAEALRERFGERIRLARWDELNGQLGDTALLVNTTTLGMHGQPELGRRSLTVARSRHCRRPGLCAAPDTAAQNGKSSRAAHRRRARHVAASGGRRFYPVVRQKACSYAAIACASGSRSEPFRPLIHRNNVVGFGVSNSAADPSIVRP